jgi:hypothetical protein
MSCNGTGITLDVVSSLASHPSHCMPCLQLERMIAEELKKGGWAGGWDQGCISSCSSVVAGTSNKQWMSEMRRTYPLLLHTLSLAYPALDCFPFYWSSVVVPAGVLDVDPSVPSSITAFGPGYIDKAAEKIVGLQVGGSHLHVRGVLVTPLPGWSWEQGAQQGTEGTASSMKTPVEL